MDTNELYQLLTLLQSFNIEFGYDTEYMEQCVNGEIDKLEGDASDDGDTDIDEMNVGC